MDNNKNHASLLKKETFTEIIDSSFKLYFSHFKEFFTVSFFSYMPIYLLLFISDTFSIYIGTPGGTNCFSTILAFLAPNNPFVWAGGGLMIYITGLYLTGHEDEVKNSTMPLSKFAWRVIAFGFLYLVLKTVLALLSILIIPALILIFISITLSLTNQAIVLEVKDIVEAPKRSFRLVVRHLGKVLLVLVFTGLLVSIPHIAYTTVLTGIQIQLPWISLLIKIGSAFITILVAPIVHIVHTYLFLDLKVRDEGTDLLLRADKIRKETGFTNEDYNEMMKRKYQGIQNVKVELVHARGLSSDTSSDTSSDNVDQQEENNKKEP
ncbi:MAG: hypothetical protein K8T10_12585 [Candidatus Eremiobacteraeota bacterium]|nr:hypothetical protein [Candidatus Eremiobacteraeota bacterium]